MTKHPEKSPALIDVAPHVQGELPDTGTYAGEIYILATAERIKAIKMHDELVSASEMMESVLNNPDYGITEYICAFNTFNTALAIARGFSVLEKPTPASPERFSELLKTARGEK